MPVFPLFVDLKDKLCVVVGGGKVAARKIDTLLQFEAKIRVVSPELSGRLEELKREGRVEVVERVYSEGDLEGAFIAIAATSDSMLNGEIYNYAVKNNIFVDVADCPQKCTFIFPSVVKRGDLVVGISTSGGYPALSKNIRKRIDGMLPQTYGDILEILKDCRKRAAVEIQDQAARKEILSRIMDEVEEIFWEYQNEKED